MAGRYKPSQVFATSLPVGEAVTLDLDALDDLIRSQGAMFEHWSAMRCPVGMIDRHDTLRRPSDHHADCSNGFIYNKEGEAQMLLTGNGLGVEQKDMGTLDSSTASITAPRFYAEEPGQDPKRVYLAPYDRLYYKDTGILVTNWELIEAHVSGKDRLSFPAVEVLQVIDSQGIHYRLGDFQVINGYIRWVGQNQPGLDPDSGKGRIYSIRYRYRPHWYIKAMGHEIRTIQVEDPMTGERHPEKAPQSATVQREYMFLNQERDPESASEVRQVRGPADGGFSPR